MHYVIIEDDPGIRDILKEVLDLLETDSTFTFLKDGHQAWKWLDQVEAGQIDNLPAIAFVDLRMPGRQGYEIAERMRAIPRLANIGIILMTAHQMTPEEHEEITRRSQADRYIAKPLPGVQGLNQMVEEIMAMRQGTVISTPPSTEDNPS